MRLPSGVGYPGKEVPIPAEHIGVVLGVVSIMVVDLYVEVSQGALAGFLHGMTIYKAVAEAPNRKGIGPETLYYLLGPGIRFCWDLAC